MKRTVSAILLVILLTSMLCSAFKIMPAEAVGTIYIRADGSIDPPTAPISTIDNMTYTLTGNIVSDDDGIVVERDNIVVDGAGYVVQGTGMGCWGEGMDLLGRSNVIIKNITIKNKGFGIVVSGSNNSVSGNTMANNTFGILVSGSNNNISGNTITANFRWGIRLSFFSNSSVSGNTITSNECGIQVSESSSNSISGNNITANIWCGILLQSSSSNSIFHNNFNNPVISDNLVNVWDDGYPSGGNYWSDYVGSDLYSGPYQNEIGGDGIGDTPYITGADNQDNYPLMKPYPWASHDIGITHVTKSKSVVGEGFTLTANASIFNYGIGAEDFNVTFYANSTIVATITDIMLSSRESTTIALTWNTSGFARGNYTISVYVSPVPNETDTSNNLFNAGWVCVAMLGDVNADSIVDIFDITTVALAFNAIPGDSNWNPVADINNDGIVDIFDIVVVALHFGETV